MKQLGPSINIHKILNQKQKQYDYAWLVDPTGSDAYR